MKILIRNSDNSVLFAAKELLVNATQVEITGRAGKGVYKGLTEKTATVVEVDNLPDDYINGMFTYHDGEWAIPDKDKHKALLDGVGVLPTQDDYIIAAQDYLDKEAKSKGYDGILSACSYAASTSPRFSSEAKACIEFRDDVWLKCYQLLDNLNDGTIDQPTMKQFLKKLPSITWPK